MKKIKSYTGIWNVEKVLYAINDFNLPFPVTFTQITWFVITEFIIILFGDIPPLSMIEGAFLKYFGIPVALTWFMSQKTFDGNLTSDKDNAGLLDPFVIMKNVKDAESLAIDILTFLTGISSRDGEKFPVLRKAVRSVTQSDSRGLLHVIDELRREDTPISRNIADHIDSFTDYDFAHLLFSDGTVENAISLDNQLNIIQVADLVLPDKDTTFEE